MTDSGMSWDHWMRAWRVHSTTQQFQRRVDRAKQVAELGARKGRMYCSLSGGKDSVAMTGILDEAGLSATVPSVHAHTKLDYPDTLDVVHQVADRLNLELEVVEPTDLGPHVQRIAKKYGGTPPQPSVEGYDEWDLLRALPAHVDVLEALGDIGRAIAAGNMCISWMYEAGFDGAFVGIRADESYGRSQYARRWGYSHDYKDGTTNVTPLLAWSGQDVYAYLVSRELPIHPWYRAAYEANRGLVEDPMRLRVDLSIPPGFASTRGSAALIAKVYPQHWRRLVAVRPELRNYE